MTTGRISITLDPDLHASLITIAESERRSLSAQAALFIEEAVRAYEARDARDYAASQVWWVGPEDLVLWGNLFTLTGLSKVNIISVHHDRNGRVVRVSLARDSKVARRDIEDAIPGFEAAMQLRPGSITIRDGDHDGDLYLVLAEGEENASPGL